MDEMTMLLVVALGCGECDGCLVAHEEFLTRERDAIAEEIRAAAGEMMKMDQALLAIRARKDERMNEEIVDLLRGDPWQS